MIQSRVDDALKREFGVEEEDNYGAMKSKIGGKIIEIQ